MIPFRDLAISAALPLLANASSAAQEPPPGTGEWLKIVLYLLGVGFLLLGVIEKIKAVFGRRPPIGQDLLKIWDKMEAMEKQLAKITTDAKDAVQSQLSEIDQRRSHAIKDVHDVMDRELGTLHEKTNEVAKKVERIDERSVQTNQKLIHLETRVSTLSDRMPRRAS